MSASMTLAEIQAKYSAIHSPEEVAQYQQNIKIPTSLKQPISSRS